MKKIQESLLLKAEHKCPSRHQKIKSLWAALFLAAAFYLLMWGHFNRHCLNRSKSFRRPGINEGWLFFFSPPHNICLLFRLQQKLEEMLAHQWIQTTTVMEDKKDLLRMEVCTHYCCIYFCWVWPRGQKDSRWFFCLWVGFFSIAQH